MKKPHSDNPQINDAITQVNTKVIGDAPSMNKKNVLISISQSAANKAHMALTAAKQAELTKQEVAKKAETKIEHLAAEAKHHYKP